MTTLPALKGKLGSTEYYTVLFTGAEIAQSVRSAQEVEAWENLSVEEKYQRDIKLTRVKREIAPYFASNKDRFTGSMILAVKGKESDCVFYPLSEKVNVKGMDSAYQGKAENMGFLQLSGKEIIVPIDGQHRARAIKYAIDGSDENGKKIDGLKQNHQLAQEQFVVILFKFNTSKAREIFNKTNQYARPTVKGQNIITDDDDVIAAISRDMTKADYKLFDSRVVRINATTLSGGSEEFTTLSTIYDINKIILEGRHGKPINIKERPSDDVERMYTEDAVSVWKEVCKRFSLFSEVLEDLTDDGAAKRVDYRNRYVCNKPIGQRALIDSLIKMENIHEMQLVKAVDLLGKIDWSVDNQIWQGVLMEGDKAKNVKNDMPANFIIYMAGIPIDKEAKDGLRNSIASNIADGENYKLPDPMV